MGFEHLFSDIFQNKNTRLSPGILYNLNFVRLLIIFFNH